MAKRRKHLDFSKFKKKILKDPEIKKEYERLDQEFSKIKSNLKIT